MARIKLKFDWMSTASGLTKIIAFMSSVIALVLYHRYANSLALFIGAYSVYSWHLCNVIAPTSCFVLLYFFVSYTSGENKPGRNFTTEMFFHVLQAQLNLIVGFIVLGRSMNNEWLGDMEVQAGTAASGAVYVLLAVIHLGDGFILFKYHRSKVVVLDSHTTHFI